MRRRAERQVNADMEAGHDGGPRAPGEPPGHRKRLLPTSEHGKPPSGWERLPWEDGHEPDGVG